MSCPDWTALAAHRRDPGAPEPAAWPEAVAHLRACGLCRPRAVAADPTLVFQLLPEPAAAPAEAEAMRQAVGALRRAAALQPARRRASASAWRAAAAAVLLALALSQAPGPGSPAGPAGWAGAGRGERESFAGAVVLPPDLGFLPVVEEVNRPRARVYQLGGSDLEVVMIVDETLDV